MRSRCRISAGGYPAPSAQTGGDTLSAEEMGRIAAGTHSAAPQAVIALKRGKPVHGTPARELASGIVDT